MDFKEMYPVIAILIFTGVLLGVGLLVLDSLGTSVKDSTSLVNESVAIAGAAGTTANDDVTAVAYFGNSSISCTPADTGCVNVTSGGVISTNSSFANGTYQISYTYDADSTATTTVSSVSSALSPIGSTWMPLLVTVIALAIVLGLIMRSFGASRK